MHNVMVESHRCQFAAFLAGTEGAASIEGIGALASAGARAHGAEAGRDHSPLHASSGQGSSAGACSPSAHVAARPGSAAHHQPSPPH
jgi:hypothetical protein